MRLLLINDQIKSIISQLVNYAKLHPVSLEMLKKGLVVGDDKNFVCTIPDGYRVVFSFENQTPSWCRHLSVSIPDKTKLPSPPSVETIMNEFGFVGTINDLDSLWVDKDSAPISINIVQITRDDALIKELNQSQHKAEL